MNDQGTINNLPVYQYRPLKGPRWIRIIQLQAAPNFDDDLVCRIIHLNRAWLMSSTDPTRNYYSAVSYAWGRADFTSELICVSTAGDTTIIQITPNVEIMLRRFRKAHKSLNLWVDAVCLNQKDRGEIQQQLSQMGSIYEESQKTRIWMGDRDDGIAKVFAFFRTLVPLRLEDLKKPECEHILTNIIRHTIGSNHIDDVQDFFHRRWLTRRWVLQELHLSRNAVIYCHNQRIAWKDLSKAFRTLSDHGQSVMSYDEQAKRALQLSRPIQLSSSTLLDTLWTYHAAKCSDPRDNVFALLGFSRSQNLKLEEVNYDQPKETLYQHFATQLISAGFLATVLDHAFAFGSPHKWNGNIPSWVPNWAGNRTHDDVGNLQRDSEWWCTMKQYRAAMSKVESKTRSDPGAQVAIVSEDHSFIRTEQVITHIWHCFRCHEKASWFELANQFRNFLGPQGFSTKQPGVLAPFVIEQLSRHRLWKDILGLTVSRNRAIEWLKLALDRPESATSSVSEKQFRARALEAWLDCTSDKQFICTRTFGDYVKNVPAGTSLQSVTLVVGLAPANVEYDDFLIIPYIEPRSYNWSQMSQDVCILQDRGYLLQTARGQATRSVPHLEGEWHESRTHIGRFMGCVPVATLCRASTAEEVRKSTSLWQYARSSDGGSPELDKIVIL